MAFWNKKNMFQKMKVFFKEHNYKFELDEVNKKIKLELCFVDVSYMLYPYITLDDEVISININIRQENYRSYDFTKLNDFNMQSKYFKAFILETGLIVLEYRLVSTSECMVEIEEIINNLFSLAEEIDKL